MNRLMAVLYSTLFTIVATSFVVALGLISWVVFVIFIMSSPVEAGSLLS